MQNPYPAAERLLYHFASAEDLARWKVFTDRVYGGQSIAQLSLSSNTCNGTVSSHLFSQSPYHASALISCCGVPRYILRTLIQSAVLVSIHMCPVRRPLPASMATYLQTLMMTQKASACNEVDLLGYEQRLVARACVSGLLAHLRCGVPPTTVVVTNAL